MNQGNQSTSEVLLLLADSITDVAEESDSPRVVISGSHGGWAAGVFALKRRLRGAIFNDAGGGKDGAGMAALSLLERYGIYGATVSAFGAKIGMALETAQGLISALNLPAGRLGVRERMAASEAAEMMRRAPGGNIPGYQIDEDYREESHIIHVSPKGTRIITMDSNSMVTRENQKDIILTGSHGGLVGNRPATKVPVVAAFYNDAGVGKDQAGISRLPRLQEAGIIGATVDAATARIGVGLETYECGIISYVNPLAREAGIVPGMKAKEAAWQALTQMDRSSRREKG
jgi:hypothetical protein